MGFGVLPSVQRQLTGMTVSLLNKASDLVRQVGGKRYLSGYLDYDFQEWEEHYGAMWPKVIQLKSFFDPNGILNPGFIRYSPEAPQQ